MLFVKSIRGKFIPNDDGIFNRILNVFHNKPNALALSTFDKFVKIMHAQGYFVQTEYTRQNL